MAELTVPPIPVNVVGETPAADARKMALEHDVANASQRTAANSGAPTLGHVSFGPAGDPVRRTVFKQPLVVSQEKTLPRQELLEEKLEVIIANLTAAGQAEKDSNGVGWLGPLPFDALKHAQEALSILRAKHPVVPPGDTPLNAFTSADYAVAVSAKRFAKILIEEAGKLLGAETFVMSEGATDVVSQRALESERAFRRAEILIGLAERVDRLGDKAFVRASE